LDFWFENITSDNPGYFVTQLKKRSKVSNRPLGKYSPNLVTLPSIHQKRSSVCSFPENRAILFFIVRRHTSLFEAMLRIKEAPDAQQPHHFKAAVLRRNVDCQNVYVIMRMSTLFCLVLTAPFEAGELGRA
jgi:hypothetical protein